MFGVVAITTFTLLCFMMVSVGLLMSGIAALSQFRLSKRMFDHHHPIATDTASHLPEYKGLEQSGATHE